MGKNFFMDHYFAGLFIKGDMIVYEHLYIRSEYLTNFNVFNNNKGIVIEIVKFSSITDPAEWLLKKSGTDNDLFCIEFDVSLTDENIAWLVRFSFLPSYNKIEVGIRCFADTDKKQKLQDAFKVQGYSAVEIVSLNGEGLDFSIGCISGVIYVMNSSLPFLVIKQIEIAAPNELKDKSNAILISKSAVEEIMEKLTRENRKLTKDLDETVTDLKNNKDYLKIALKEKETEKILAFYHNEYEVLPLWYKRFGHIIKIITGHRKIKNRG
jgi:hypothetical protein